MSRSMGTSFRSKRKNCGEKSWVMGCILKKTGRFEMEVNVRGGLRFGKRADVVMYRDALSEVCKDVSFENGFEVFLS